MLGITCNDVIYIYVCMHVVVLAEFIYISCGFLSYPDSLKMKCPQQKDRDSWVSEKAWSVLRPSPEANKSLLPGGQRAVDGTDRYRL